MRLNQYLAVATGLSRRSADRAIEQGRVKVDGAVAKLGSTVSSFNTVTFDSQIIKHPVKPITLTLNKPVGYVCSRNGQGSPTIYDLLPPEYHQLKPAGRLDKDSSGLLLLTNDGQLANQLTHPRYAKIKVYLITLDRPLSPEHQKLINDEGVLLADGLSRLQLKVLDKEGTKWRVAMREGRNRQIRRTFDSLGYSVNELVRTHVGSYKLGQLRPGHFQAQR